MSEVKVFHESRASLGEGLFVDKAEQRVLWVDINNSALYSKSLDGACLSQYRIGGFPSAVLNVENEKATVCVISGLIEYDLATGDSRVLSENPESDGDEIFRLNDGVMLPDGRFIYGTMQTVPSGPSGGLYCFNGSETVSLGVPVGIPNGFVVLEEPNILIADSLTREINLFEIDEVERRLRFVRCWHDFSSEHFTPDGGCTDYNGNVYFALWDGSGVAVLDYSGNLIEIISLPVPRPTNCKLAGGNRLLVTTAREGLTHDQVRQAPLSGSVLEIKLT